MKLPVMYNKMNKFVLTLLIIITVTFLMIPDSQASSSGKLIRFEGSTTVYYIGVSNRRYIFPSEKVAVSWYPDFPRVETVTLEEISLYPLGSLTITYRPGVKMVKLTTDPKVYAISSGRTLRWITNEEIAAELYGHDWAKQIDDLADQFFSNYKLGQPITSAHDYDKDLEKNLSSINSEVVDDLAAKDALATIRDTIRLSDIKTIQTALEIYYAEQDAYPLALSKINLGSDQYNCLDETGFNAYPCQGENLYCQKISKNPSGNYDYLAQNEQAYTINFTLEEESTIYQGKNCLADPNGISCN